MNIDELKYARQAACNIKDYMSNTPEEKAAVDLWIALIDAEIAAQSVTDADVQAAIERCQKAVDDDPVWGYRVNNHFSMPIAIIKTCLTALRQMRTEPCDSCKKAVRWECEFYDKSGVAWRVVEVDHCPDCGRKLPEPPGKAVE